MAMKDQNCQGFVKKCYTEFRNNFKEKDKVLRFVRLKNLSVPSLILIAHKMFPLSSPIEQNFNIN